MFTKSNGSLDRFFVMVYNVYVLKLERELLWKTVII